MSRSKIRTSARANSIARALGFDINNEFVIANVIQTIDILLSRGNTEEEVANVIRPLTPAYSAVFKSLEGY